MPTKKWEKIVEKALSDEGFKKRLLGSPAEILGEAGLEVPAGATVHVVESTDKDIWLVLPQHKAGYKFLSPYVAVYESAGGDPPKAGSKTCTNPAAGCAE